MLKAIFNTAILDDLIVKNPCRVKGGTDRLTDRAGSPTSTRWPALTQPMPEQYRAAVTLAPWGTLRRGEVLGLNREHVDLTLPLFVGATGERLSPSNFWVIWDTARRRASLTWVCLYDLRQFAATMVASTDASTKEIMSRGGWKSVAMVVCYEHTSEERDALLAQELNPYTLTENAVPISTTADSVRARSAHDDLEVEGEYWIYRL